MKTGAVVQSRKVTGVRDVNTTKITKEGRPGKTALNDCLRTETIHEFQSNDGQAIVALPPDPIDGHATYRFDEVPLSQRDHSSDPFR